MAIVRTKFSAAGYHGQLGLATVTPTLIHSSTTAAGTVDEVHIWVSNPTAAATTLILYLPTTGNAPVVQEIPANSGYFLVYPGLQLASGNSVYATIGGTGAGFTAGFVNRLTTGA